MVYMDLAFLVSAMAFAAAITARNIAAANAAAVARSKRSQRIRS